MNWKKHLTTPDWLSQYRGITARIKVDPETEKPVSINWYIGGQLNETSPVTCSLDIDKRIAKKVIDR